MTNPNEEWKDVPGYTGYKASSAGRIMNKRGAIAKQTVRSDGYAAVSAVSDATRQKTQAKVHRLVALAFLENPHRKPQVNHKDSDKLNNAPSNLEWATAKENVRHAVNSGRFCVGSMRFNAKLSESDIPEIIYANRAGATASEIARCASVSEGLVRHILKGRCWTHVTKLLAA